jgi:L-lactate dehydrogenase
MRGFQSCGHYDLRHLAHLWPARTSPRVYVCDIPRVLTSFLVQVGRVFGSGTALDSSRFRTLLADRLGVDTRSVHGMILGEHGDSSVAWWSAVNVGGISLRSLNPKLGLPDDPENWESVHTEVINAAYEIIKSKGYTNWAIGMTVAALTEAVIRNEHRVLALSVPVKGRFGITDDVYLSVPAVLGTEGVTEVLNVALDEAETEKLRKSGEAIAKVQNSLDFSFLTAGGAGKA